MSRAASRASGDMAASKYSAQEGLAIQQASYIETVRKRFSRQSFWHFTPSHHIHQIAVVFNNFRYLTLNQHVPNARNSVNSSGRFSVPAPGFEICPPDDDALTVCKQHCWQAQALAFADGSAYCTAAAADKLGHSMSFALRHTASLGVRFGSGTAYLESRGNAVAFNCAYAEHPVYAACGFDVLLRQPCEPE